MNDLAGIRQKRIDLKRSYLRYKGRKLLFIAVLIPSLFILGGIAVSTGSATISLADVFTVILGKIIPGLNAAAVHADIIIWQLRLPRIIMGVMAGLALGSSGAVMQVLLRNPLADPYMLGIASAASFGASLAIIFGIGLLDGPYLIIGNAFLFSLLASGLILGLSGKREASPEAMVLTGLALLFFFQAMTMIVQYFGNADAVKAAVFWTVGNLGKADWEKISILFPLVTVGLLLLFWRSSDLNIMNAGDATAKSLGVNVGFTRVFNLVVCSFLVAGVVSFTGTIGFVGLVAPHVVRMIIGCDNRILVPASGLVGAALLILADTVARTVLSPVILPVGAVTAFLGVPLFIGLIITNRGTDR
jgi:iron complex transport system permease protein